MEKIKCPSCKKKIPESSEVCPKCYFLIKPETTYSSKPRARAIITNKEDLFKLGMQAMRNKDYHKAIECWENLSRTSPNNISVLENLSAAYLQVNRTSDAEECIKKALKVNPNDAGEWEMLGSIYVIKVAEGEGLNTVKKSITCFQKALELNPLKHVLILQVAAGFFALRDLESAKKNVVQYIKLCPNDQDGKIFYNQKPQDK